MKLIAIYSKWSKRVCWIVYGEECSHAMTWLQWNRVPFAKKMERWATFTPSVEQVKGFLIEDSRKIPVIDSKGNVISYKLLSIKKS